MRTGYLATTAKRVSFMLAAVVLASSALFITQVSAGGGGVDFCEDGIPNAYLLVAPTNKGVGSLTIDLDGSYSVACDTPIVDYSWDLGDGTTANGLNISHTYGVGTWTPSLTITDQAGLTHTHTWGADVNVKASNTDPELSDVTTSVLTRGTVEVDISGTDADGDSLSYSLVSSQNTQYGSVQFNGLNTFTYSAHNADNAATDSFTVRAEDGYGGVKTATVNVDILPRIVAIPDAAETLENQSVVIDVTQNDYAVDGLDFELYWQSGATNGGSVALNIADGTVTYTPAYGFYGEDTFEYGIKSVDPITNDWNLDFATVTVTVVETGPPNVAPVAVDDTLTVDEDSSANLYPKLNDSDSDGALASGITVTSQPTNGTITVYGNVTVIYTPNANFNGSDSFTYYVTDNEGADSEIATVNITVNSVNDIPAAGDDSAAVQEDGSITIDVLANDADVESTVLAVEVSANPNSGVATVNVDGTISYTPNANFNGSDSFTYTVTDADGEQATAIVNIVVNSVYDLPTAGDDSAAVQEDGSITIDVLANDTSDQESSDLTVAVSTSQGNGTAAVNTDGTVTYTPNANFNGSDSFTYTVTDSAGMQSTATVTIDVISVNDAPSASLSATYISKKTGYQFDASGSADSDGQIVSYTFNFDDGTSITTTSSSVTHTYKGKSRDRVVSVIVTDNEGATTTASTQI